MIVIVPNFALIGQTVAKIWPFVDFIKWRPLYEKHIGN